MPKLICVCVALGALVTGLVLWVTAPVPQREDLLEVEHRIFASVMVPAICGAMFFGLLLLLQHPRVFIRLRWLQIKLAVVAIFLPVVHVGVTTQFAALINPDNKDDNAATLVTWLGIAVITQLLLIILGRQKPRLGQNWAKDFPRR